MTRDRARWLHTITAAVTIAALVLQTALVLQGSSILDETNPPGLGARLGRLVSYFTIQSNLLIAISTTTLAMNAQRDGDWWRVVRVAGLVGITVTGIVHFTLLRPLIHLDGWDWVADKGLHMVVPVLAIGSWLLVGPWPRFDRRAMIWALAWPIVWLIYALVVGKLTGWYPYPFLDVEDKGAASVFLVSLGITALFLVVIVAAYSVDRRFARR